MDVLAHGLWGAVPFVPGGKRRYAAALLVGMAPDVLSFGVFHLLRPDWILSRIAGEISGPPALEILPRYVFYAYNVTHSLLVCIAVFVIASWWLRRPAWILAPWVLHIACDIPTHATDYFPTPFFWPLETPFVNGQSWSRQGFLVANYSVLLLAYIIMVGILAWRKRRTADDGRRLSV